MLIYLVGVVVVVVIVVDDNVVLLVFIISNTTKEKVLSKIKRGQHREDVEEQTEQSHRRGQGQGKWGGAGDKDVGSRRRGTGRERGSGVSPFEG